MEIKKNNPFLGKAKNIFKKISLGPSAKKSTNSENWIVSKNYSKTYTGSLYQTHTLIDLLDLKLAQMQLDIAEDCYFELDTILSTYAGHTIFSLFIEEPEFFKQVYSQFCKHEIEKEEN